MKFHSRCHRWKSAKLSRSITNWISKIKSSYPIGTIFHVILWLLNELSYNINRNCRVLSFSYSYMHTINSFKNQHCELDCLLTKYALKWLHFVVSNFAFNEIMICRMDIAFNMIQSNKLRLQFNFAWMCLDACLNLTLGWNNQVLQLK